MKLNIGSGERHLEGFLSVDIDGDLQGIDVVHDVSCPLPFVHNTVERIFSSHCLEHVWWEDVPGVLKDWHRVLVSGGVLEIWVPDFTVAASIGSRDSVSWSDIEHLEWIIHNRRTHNLCVNYEHRAAFSFPILKCYLEMAGFVDVERIPVSDFPFPGVHVGINMGVRCRKR